MKRAVVCVATTPQYKKGMFRLMNSEYLEGNYQPDLHMYPVEPAGSPKHQEVPYAFKAYALQHAAEHADLLLWADACILPIRDMTPLWERIESEGYWFSKNGWSNYKWTADLSYPDLFASNFLWEEPNALECARIVNRNIPHVVATAFGLNVRHPKGAAFLREYFRLASTTKAFCGPWTNLNALPDIGDGKTVVVPLADYPRVAPCGPADVRGHRHDQTAASVIAWRLGMQLTEPPNVFAYANFQEGVEWSPDHQDKSTILCAHGRY